MMNKKADIGLGVIIVIIIIVLFLAWLINEGWKECRVDADCKSGQYCTSQFECKDIPVIEKTSPSQNANLNMAAWVIGISLIAAAIIMKWDTLFRKKKKPGKKEEEEEYVDLSKKRKAEGTAQYEDFLEEKY